MSPRSQTYPVSTFCALICVLTGCLCLSRDCLAFCTEPVFASLANVFGQWDNLPSPVPTDIKEYKLYDVETKYGLMQVTCYTSVELLEPPCKNEMSSQSDKKQI